MPMGVESRGCSDIGAFHQDWRSDWPWAQIWDPLTLLQTWPLKSLLFHYTLMTTGVLDPNNHQLYSLYSLSNLGQILDKNVKVKYKIVIKKDEAIHTVHPVNNVKKWEVTYLCVSSVCWFPWWDAGSNPQAPWLSKFPKYLTKQNGVPQSSSHVKFITVLLPVPRSLSHSLSLHINNWFGLLISSELKWIRAKWIHDGQPLARRCCNHFNLEPIGLSQHEWMKHGRTRDYFYQGQNEFYWVKCVMMSCQTPCWSQLMFGCTGEQDYLRPIL